MNLVKSSLITLLLFAGVGAALPLVAVDTVGASAKDEVLKGVATTGADSGTSLEASISDIVNMLLFIVGVIAVIVIIIGGIMYATSAGDPARAKKAKDAILYAVIGLVIAILAYAIVNFVIDAL